MRLRRDRWPGLRAKTREDDELGVGARVELDGTAGEVVEKGEKGWWKVRVDGEGTLRSARAGKLTVLATNGSTL